jgi:hypothetical protein
VQQRDQVYRLVKAGCSLFWTGSQSSPAAACRAESALVHGFGLQIAVAAAVLAVALASQWHGELSVAVADSVSMITAGVNLVRAGEYVNPFGLPELWFPPVYPILIGVFSLGGYLDPHATARLIAAVSGLGCLALVGYVCAQVRTAPALVSFVAMIVLACNPIYQLMGISAMSESPATLLSFAAFCVWLGASDSSSPVRFSAIGLLTALSYLTRPEALLLLPGLTAIDWFSGRNRLIVVKNYSIAAGVLLASIAPYVAYLGWHTGTLTLSTKSEVNLAEGRSKYFGVPREYIDPDTLVMGYYHSDTNASSTVSRCLWNCSELTAAYNDMFRPPYGYGLLLSAALGAGCLAIQGYLRILSGLLVQFAYLVVLVYFHISTRYLHATLPGLSILIGFGLANLAKFAFTMPSFWLLRLATVGLVGWGTIGLAEGGSRYPRWAITGGIPSVTLLRDVGLAFAARGLPKGVMYEQGATIGYYAGQIRGRITPNDLDTLLRYINAHEQGRPVYLAVSSLQRGRYHPSVAELLDAQACPFERILVVSDERGQVVVFRVK